MLKLKVDRDGEGVREEGIERQKGAVLVHQSVTLTRQSSVQRRVYIRLSLV